MPASDIAAPIRGPVSPRLSIVVPAYNEAAGIAAFWARLAPVLAGLVWALAFVGQGLGAEQMYALRRFVDESLDVREG